MDTEHGFPVEVKAEALSEDGIFEGYGSVFDHPIVHPIYGRDIVKPGAFADSLASKGTKGIKMLWQHDTAEPIGKWLDLAEDGKGLYVKGQLLLDLPKARDAYVLMKNKVIDGLSIGFDARDKENEWDPQRQTRTLHKINLYEVSAVTFPAQTIAKIRSIKSATAVDNIRDYERFLRDAGFSALESRRLASAGWQALRRDADSAPDEQLSTGLLAALRDARSSLSGPLFGGFRNVASTKRGGGS